MVTAGTSWRRYRVIRRKAESETVTSLHLVAEDGGALEPFRAGQFLTFRLTSPDGRPVARNYSLSSDPGDFSSYRISVKRELSPPDRPDLPQGFGSGFMHRQAEVGAVLEASGPKGQFQLDDTSMRPVPPPAATRQMAASTLLPGAITVTFSRSGLSAPWDGTSRTLLDFAEAQGLSPAFSCRNGICNTCRCEVEGEVRYIDEPLEEPGTGFALLCCSVPASALVVNI